MNAPSSGKAAFVQVCFRNQKRSKDAAFAIAIAKGVKSFHGTKL
jgi:hypothetical protein